MDTRRQLQLALGHSIEGARISWGLFQTTANSNSIVGLRGHPKSGEFGPAISPAKYNLGLV